MSEDDQQAYLLEAEAGQAEADVLRSLLKTRTQVPPFDIRREMKREHQDNSQWIAQLDRYLADKTVDGEPPSPDMFLYAARFINRRIARSNQ